MIVRNLQEKGHKVIRKAWDAEDVDWSMIDFAVFRSTWDYFHRFDEFFVWLEKTRTQTNLINCAEIIYWNQDKHYLADLIKKEVNVSTTTFIEKGEACTLEKLF